MLRLSILLATALAATAADAGALQSATWTQSLPGMDITVTRSGSTCTSTGADVVQQMIDCPTYLGLGAGGYATPSSFSVSLTMPSFGLQQFTTGGAFPIYTKATLAGSARIQGSAHMATGITNVGGMVTVKLAAHVMGSAIVPGGPGSTLVKLPFSVGKVGTGYHYFKVLTQPHYLTVDSYGWTPGTRTFTGLTSNFVPLPDVVAMGSFQGAPWDYRLPPSHFPRSQNVVLTWGSGATVTVVAPSRISIDGPLAQRRTVSLTTLSLSFPGDPCCIVHGTPEPPTLFLLGAGFAALLLARGGAR